MSLAGLILKPTMMLKSISEKLKQPAQLNYYLFNFPQTSPDILLLI
jgi:hypothetical protein